MTKPEMPHSRSYDQKAIRYMFGTAVSFEPSQLYSDAGAEPTERLADSIVDYLTPSLKYPSLTGYLWAGIEDTQKILTATFDDSGIDQEGAARLVVTPATTDAMAKLALYSGMEMHSYLNDLNRQEFFRASPADGALRIESGLPEPNSELGCPFAGKYDHQRRVDPLFKKFVPWAGQLVVNHYYHG